MVGSQAGAGEGPRLTVLTPRSPAPRPPSSPEAVRPRPRLPGAWTCERVQSAWRMRDPDSPDLVVPTRMWALPGVFPAASQGPPTLPPPGDSRPAAGQGGCCVGQCGPPEPASPPPRPNTADPRSTRPRPGLLAAPQDPAARPRGGRTGLLHFTGKFLPREQHMETPGPQ